MLRIYSDKTKNKYKVLMIETDNIKEYKTLKNKVTRVADSTNYNVKLPVGTQLSALAGNHTRCAFNNVNRLWFLSEWQLLCICDFAVVQATLQLLR